MIIIHAHASWHMHKLRPLWTGILALQVWHIHPYMTNYWSWWAHDGPMMVTPSKGSCLRRPVS